MSEQRSLELAVEPVALQPEKQTPDVVEAFTRAQNLILEDGDIIDRLKWLKRNSYAGAVGLTGAGVAGFQFGLSPNFISSQVALATGYTTSLLTKPLAARWQRRSVRPVQAAFDDLRASFGYDSVEIYRQTASLRDRRRNRKSEPELHVVWEPTLARLENTPAGYAQAVDDIRNALTVDSPVASVSIPESAVKHIGVKPPESVKTLSREAWLKQVKAQGIKDVAKQEDGLCVFSRDELAQYAEKLPRFKDEPLHSFMETLRKLQPGHSSLRPYDDYLRGGSRDIVRLERSLKRKVEARLHDVMVIQEKEDDGLPLPDKTRVHITGQLDISKGRELGGTLRWLASNGMHTGESTRLLPYLGTSLDEVAALPAQFDRLPKPRARDLCEVGAWLAAHEVVRSRLGQSNRLNEEVTTNLPATMYAIAPERGMQERIADRTLHSIYSVVKRHPDATERRGISLRPGQLRRWGRSTLALCGVALAGFGGAKAGLQYDLDYFNKHVSPLYEKSRGGLLSGNKNPLSDKELDQAVDRALNDSAYRLVTKPIRLGEDFEGGTRSVLRRIFGTSDTTQQEEPSAAEKANDRLARQQYDQRQGNPDSIATVGDVGAGIGNVGHLPNKPVWYVESYNQMLSEGRWPESTANILVDKGEIMWFQRHLDDINKYVGDRTHLSNEEYQQAIDDYHNRLMRTPHLPLPAEVAKDQPMLRVQRTVSTSILGPDGFQDSFYDGFHGPQPEDLLERADRYTAINIPVLEGTVPIAAAIQGNQPASLVRLPSGVYVLLAKNINSGHEPVEIEYWLADDKSDRKVHAITPLFSADSSVVKPKPIKPVIKPWLPYLPEVANISKQQRLNLQTNYLKTTFKYRANPIKDPKVLEQGANTYARSMLANRIANCNVANTLLALSNPELLNYVTGYNNSNTAEQEQANAMHLSSSEAHAWDVDKQGNVYDGTPGGQLTPEDAAHFKEDYAKKFSYTSPAEAKQQRKERNQKIALAVGLLGLGFVLRRRIRSRAQKTTRDLAKISIAYMDYDDSRLAYDVLNNAIYSEKTVTPERYADSQRRSQRDPNIGTEAAWKNFSRGHNHKAIKPVVKQQLKAVTDPETKRSLRQARRLNKLYRLAYANS